MTRPHSAPRERGPTGAPSARARRHAPLFALYLVLLVIAAALFFLAGRDTGAPAAVPAPQVGKVVLTVRHQDRQVQFDMHRLEALPQVTHKVQTPWYLRKASFQGPLLRDVLAAASASGTRIAAIAVNDYEAEIPFSDALQYEVIVALRMDGKPLSPRDKGPLFVVYPYDQFSPAEVGRYQDISVWQLDALRVQ